MTRQTSIDAYREIMASGRLAHLEETVYAAIFANGPATIKEVCCSLPHIPDTSLSPTFARLERRDAIFTEKKRPCRITGNMAHEWDLTYRMPEKVKRINKSKCEHCDGRGWNETLEENK